MSNLLIFYGDLMSYFIDYERLFHGRRDFIKKMVSGFAGMSLGAPGMTGCSSNLNRTPALRKTSSHDPGESRVALVTGNDRRNMVYEALKPFENNIKKAIKEKQVFIKVNCVREGYPLIATYPNAVRGILDFLKPIYDRKIIIGESTASPLGTYATFEDYGFLPLEREYNIKLVELNDEPTTYHWILDKDLYPVPIRIINTFLKPNNYTISVTRLKTHNRVIATLSLKNIVMGAPLKITRLKINEKQKMHAKHTTAKMINFNMFLMAHRVYPDFAILDGVEGMEGNGPSNGEPVDHKVVLAGLDYVSVDRIGSELMGIPWENIGYLNYCATGGLGQGDRSKIKILGPDPEDHVIKYKLHDNIEWQYKWKDELILQKT